MVSNNMNDKDLKEDEILRNRIKVQFKSTDKSPLSGFQLPEFMNNLSKNYYKLDLSNEISRLISSSNDMRNIFIINESFEINNSYSYLKKSKEINLHKAVDVEKLYNLGKPIGMFPNNSFIKINLLFKLYETVYTYFNQNKINKLPKSLLKTYINEDFDLAIRKFRIDCIEQINEDVSIRKTLKEQRINQVEKYIDEINQEYTEYSKDYERIHEFENIINKNEVEIDAEEKAKYRDIERKYFTQFFTYLRKLDRPIVGIYDNDDNKITIIKSEYMLNDKESDNFLDYKDYSHNSPFIITIIAGFVLGEIVYLVKKARNKDKENTNIEQVNMALEEENRNEVDSLIKEIANSDELNQTQFIENNYIREKFEIVKEKTQRNAKNTLKRYGLANDKMIINLDGYREQKAHIENDQKHGN